ncbi:hypothetical protein [Yoonia sp. 208BN28-4]|uniref:hypothetical protein n=1 Tax=Yoonia sp. 208BN28-4 TaxID=3126505 RepID=UPI0030A9ED0D
MDTDTMFVLGAIIAVFAIPAVISAFLDGRTPRVPAVIVLIGAVMIGYAINQRPGAYNFDTLPDVFVRVVGQYL